PMRPNKRGPTSPTISPSTMMTTSNSMSVNPAWSNSRACGGDGSQRDLVDREDREQDRENDERDDQAHAENDDRLEKADRSLELGAYLVFEGFGDLEKHFFEAPRLFTHPDHVDSERREGGVLAHADRDGPAAFHVLRDTTHGGGDC